MILDGHSSHTRCTAEIDAACDNGLVMLCFPLPSAHKTHSFDVTFIATLRNYYGRERDMVAKKPRQGAHSLADDRGFRSSIITQAAILKSASSAFETDASILDMQTFQHLKQQNGRSSHPLLSHDLHLKAILLQNVPSHWQKPRLLLFNMEKHRQDTHKWPLSQIRSQNISRAKRSCSSEDVVSTPVSHKRVGTSIF